MKLNLKDWVIIYLAALALIGGWHYGYEKVAAQIIVSSAVCLIFAAVLKALKKKKMFSRSALITGLIIGLVLAPGEVLWRVILICLIAMASKFIKFNNRHIFNPAAFGLLAGLFFGTQMGWWAAYSAPLVIIVGAHLLYELKGRWKMIFSFFAALIVLIFAQSLMLDASFVDQVYLVIGTSFFFAFFMLTDPMTAPFKPKDLVIFGIIAAAGTFASVIYWPPAVFIGGLLMANLAVPILNKINFSRSASLTQSSRVI